MYFSESTHFYTYLSQYSSSLHWVECLRLECIINFLTQYAVGQYPLVGLGFHVVFGSLETRHISTWSGRSLDWCVEWKQFALVIFTTRYLMESMKTNSVFLRVYAWWMLVLCLKMLLLHLPGWNLIHHCSAQSPRVSMSLNSASQSSVDLMSL